MVSFISKFLFTATVTAPTFLSLGLIGVIKDSTNYCKHSKKCTFYTLRFGCSFAAVNTIKPQLL